MNKISPIQKTQTTIMNQFRVNFFCISLEVNEKSFLPDFLNCLKLNLRYSKLAISAKNPRNLYNIFVSQLIIFINITNSHLYTLLVKYHPILEYVNNLRKIDQAKYLFSLAISWYLGGFHLDLYTLYITKPRHKHIKPTISILKAI